MIVLSRIMRPIAQLCSNHCFKYSPCRNIKARGFKSEKTQNRLTKLAPKDSFKMAKPNYTGSISISKNMIKCTLFAAGFTGLAYTECAITQYEKIRKDVYNELKGVIDRYLEYNGASMKKQGEIRQELNRWWNNLSNGHKAFWPICFLNVVVFGFWRIPRLQPLMLKYFTFSPVARVVCWPMLFSTFSHYNLLHLGANMYVLHSFSRPTCHTMGYEDFIAFYLSAGVLTSLGSAIVKVITSTPGASLGASGAILALLGYFCSSHPEAELGIIFIPYFRMSAENALWGIIAFDAAGIIFKFKLFDHGAHLAGTFLGMFYAKYGEQWWQTNKKIFWKYLNNSDKRVK